MKLKQNSFTAVKLFDISFISMCGQFKLQVLYFSVVLYLFSLMILVVSYLTVLQISWREH